VSRFSRASSVTPARCYRAYDATIVDPLGVNPASLDARELAADPTGACRLLVTDKAGRLLDFGRTSYRPPAALRDHVINLHETCTFAGCRRAADNGELDHIKALRRRRQDQQPQRASVRQTSSRREAPGRLERRQEQRRHGPLDLANGAAVRNPTRRASDRHDHRSSAVLKIGAAARNVWSMVIRAQRADDDAAVRQLITAAFGDDGLVADLAAALRARPDRGRSLVAEKQGEIVGHVQLSTSWVDAPQQLVDVLVLSPLGVAPEHQRQGVGRALVAAALAEAASMGAPLVFLEGDPGYYAQLGWEPGGGRGFTPPSVRIPDAAFQVVVLPSWQPSMVGALVYNDTFWSHDCVGLRPAT
jgi:putative acetyltransferase